MLNVSFSCFLFREQTDSVSEISTAVETGVLQAGLSGGVVSNEPLKDGASLTFMLLIVGIWSNSLQIGNFPAAAPDRVIKSLFFVHFEKLSFKFFQSFLRLFSVKKQMLKNQLPK